MQKATTLHRLLLHHLHLLDMYLPHSPLCALRIYAPSDRETNVRHVPQGEYHDHEYHDHDHDHLLLGLYYLHLLIILLIMQKSIA
jgi:hypothetical protein